MFFLISSFFAWCCQVLDTTEPQISRLRGHGWMDGWMAHCHLLVLWLIQLSIAPNLVDDDWTRSRAKKQRTAHSWTLE